MAKLVYDENGRLLFTKEMKEEYTILMPQMLPIHFGMFRKMLQLEGYKVAQLNNEGRNVVDLFEAKNVRAILRAAGSMDEPTREAIAEAFRLLGNSLKETIPEWIDRAADDLRARIAPKGEERGDSDGQDKEAQ